MKDNRIVKLLVPGIFVGLILGLGLGLLVGVNATDPVPNYIGGAVACIVPVLLNCTIVLNGTAKLLDRKISFLNILKRIFPYLLIAAVIGLLVFFVVIEQVMGISTCDLSRVTNAVIQALLGVTISTIMAYIAATNYASDVKYTRKTKSKK